MAPSDEATLTDFGRGVIAGVLAVLLAGSTEILNLLEGLFFSLPNMRQDSVSPVELKPGVVGTMKLAELGTVGIEEPYRRSPVGSLLWLGHDRT